MPEYLSGIFEVLGKSCVSDNDCESKYQGPAEYTNSQNAFFTCQNDTVTNNGVTEDISICIFQGCDDSTDCSGAVCRNVLECNPETNEFYPDEMMLFSKICIPSSGCPTFRTEGEWTNETMVCLYFMYLHAISHSNMIMIMIIMIYTSVILEKMERCIAAKYMQWCVVKHVLLMMFFV